MARVRGAELVCPGCGASADASERFCPACGLPLVYESVAGDPDPGESADVSERRRRMRKIAPQLAEGPLVKVAWVCNQAEGEFLQSLLLEQGVPSLLRRSPGFDVPDMLFAGPRDVMVAASGADVAHETLLDAGLISPAARRRPVTRPWPLLAGLLGLLAAGAAVIWALSLVVH